jgi:ABC-type spermidine/putrescine transport system permease subunit II
VRIAPPIAWRRGKRGRRAASGDSFLLAPGAVPLTVYLAVVLLVPMIVLALYSFWTPEFYAVSHAITGQNYQAAFTESLYLKLLVKSLAIGIICAILITVVGFVVAYSISFRLRRGGSLLLAIIMSTLLCSYAVRVFAWSTILGPHGLLNIALIDLHVIHEPLTFLLFGYFSVVLVLVYVYLPFAILPIYAGFQGIDRHLLEASRDLGATGFSTFRKIILPLGWPGIRIALLFGFILTASDYVTPDLVGGTQGEMLGNIIDDQFTQSGNYALGAALSFELIVGIVGVFLLAHYGGRLLAGAARRAGVALRQRRDRRAGATGLAGPVRRGLMRVPYGVIGTCLVMAFLAAPLIVVIVFSFNNSTDPSLPWAGLTTHWYRYILALAPFHRVLLTSIIVAAGAVGASLVIGVPAAVALARRRFAASRLLGTAVYGPVAVPGVTLGVAFLAVLLLTGQSAGVVPTILAQSLLTIPYIVIVVRTRMLRLDPKIEEAARDLGASRRRVFRTITAPIILPAVLGAGILAAAISLDELTVTNFTIGASATVPVWLFSLIHTQLSPAFNAVGVLIWLSAIVLMAGAFAVMSSKRGAGGRSARAVDAMLTVGDAATSRADAYVDA